MKKNLLLALALCSMIAAQAVTPGTVNGAFSVAANKQVYFSQGNLQYHCADKTWSFAAHQYDIIGSGNKKMSDKYDGVIDLFGWSAAVNNYGAINSVNVDDYAGDFTDWGQNAIINGGNKANVWRTLTQEEWLYLVKIRKNADKKIGVANVNGINGLVILPDVFKRPKDVKFVPGMAAKDGNAYYKENNVYTAEEWKQMESAGAVFLPADGRRGGSSVYSVGLFGNYWSATPSSEDPTLACYFYFHSGHFTSAYGVGRILGQSVRLVRDVK